jgi:hypothetical protein
MKKVLLVGAVALLGLASCKKDYTCECTTTVDLSAIGGGKTTSTASTTINATKSDATEACEASNVTNAAGSVKCEIK